MTKIRAFCSYIFSCIAVAEKSNLYDFFFHIKIVSILALAAIINCCSYDIQSRTKGKELLVIGAFCILIIAKWNVLRSASGHSKVQAFQLEAILLLHNNYCCIIIIIA